jgi:TRAP transporter TAXI family solute receptor
MYCQKKHVLSSLFLLVFIFSISFGPNASQAAEKKTLSWGSTATTSGSFPYFPVTAKILNDNIPEINLTVRSTGAVVHNARLLEKREVDIGAIDTKFAHKMIQGIEPYEGKPFSDIRFLYVNATNQNHMVVSEKSGIKDIYGLEGQIFCPGMQGSSTADTFMQVLRILKINAKIRHHSMADAIEAMQNEQIKGLAKDGAYPDSTILNIMSAAKIKILSFSDADLEKIIKNIPGTKKAVVPAGVYPGIGEFKTYENEWTEFVRTDFPEEIAYKIEKTVWGNRKEIQKMAHMFIGDRSLPVALGINVDRCYMHPGAVRACRELGFEVPKRLVPPEMGEK